MKLNRREIHARALEVLEEHPEGIRWSELLAEVKSDAGETPHNSIHGGIHNLLTTRKDAIIKVARGTYKLAKYVEEKEFDELAEESRSSDRVNESTKNPAASPREEDFYRSFAEWLEENDEATIAEPFGGSNLGGKWGTPDVIGVLKPRAQDIFKFEPQIVSAEIKSVPGQPVVAFGQAVAYRLFSHRTFIVVPKNTADEDLARLKALCTLHGIGLVTFMVDVEAPSYNLIVIPENANPDMFYVNNMLERLKHSAAAVLNRLFG